MEQIERQRRLAAILAADVAGFSRMMSEDEEGTLARLQALQSAVVEPAIASHHGRIVKTTGDGLLAEFGSVTDAVRAATAIQRAAAEHNRALPDARRIAYRIGINVGDVILHDDDIFGDGVNVAARLQTMAEPGGICVSGVVRDQVHTLDDIAFVDRGLQPLRGIDRSIHIYAVEPDRSAMPPRPARAPKGRRTLHALLALAIAAAIGAIAWAWLGRTPPAPPLPVAETAPAKPPPLSIVVLPFNNIGGEPSEDFLADALTEDITTDLSRIVGSFVIARNTAFAYKGKAADVRTLGQELGVGYVLEGSIRRAGTRLRISVQLIDAETGAHLWAERFDTDRTNAEGVETLVTGRITTSLNQELVAAESRRAQRAGDLATDANEFAMRGWHAFNRENSPETNAEARLLFGRALDLDPDNVSALLGFARTYANDVLNQWSISPGPALTAVETATQRALQIVRGLAEGQFVLGEIARARRQHAIALSHYERAIALNPNLASAYSSIGIVKILLGRSEEALDPIEHSLKRSPHDRSASIRMKFLCDAYFHLGRDDVAIDWCRRSVATQPIWWAYLHLAALHALTGRLDRGKAAAADLERTMPGYTIARHRAARFSTAPGWIVQNERFYEGLRLAGVPEE